MLAQWNLLIWIDEILVHASWPTELLKTLEAVFKICREKGLKFNPLKWDLVTKKAQFCGRIIDENGTKCNNRQFETLSSMETPTTAGALM